MLISSNVCESTWISIGSEGVVDGRSFVFPRRGLERLVGGGESATRSSFASMWMDSWAAAAVAFPRALGLGFGFGFVTGAASGSTGACSCSTGFVLAGAFGFGFGRGLAFAVGLPFPTPLALAARPLVCLMLSFASSSSISRFPSSLSPPPTSISELGRSRFPSSEVIESCRARVRAKSTLTGEREARRSARSEVPPAWFFDETDDDDEDWPLDEDGNWIPEDTEEDGRWDSEGRVGSKATGLREEF